MSGKAGAVIVKPAQDTFYGGYAGYFRDPDRHLWEVAWNPAWKDDGGRIADPVLALVVIGDPWIMSDWVRECELAAIREGTQDRFVSRFVDAVGHCAYTREQMGHAFDALVQWERDGKRPAGGEQK